MFFCLLPKLAEKSCKGEGEEGEGELSRIEHAAKQQLKSRRRLGETIGHRRRRSSDWTEQPPFWIYARPLKVSRVKKENLYLLLI